MNRRNVLLGLGTAAAGSGIVFGSGAFTQVQAERSVTIGIDQDSNALLALEASEDVASVDNSDETGELVIDTNKLSDDNEGFNVGSTVQIGETDTDLPEVDEATVVDALEGSSSTGAAFKLTNNFDTVAGDDDNNDELDIGINLEDVAEGSDSDPDSSLIFIGSEYDDEGDSVTNNETLTVEDGSQVIFNDVSPGNEIYFAIRIETTSTTDPEDFSGEVTFRAGPNLADEFPTDATVSDTGVVNVTQDTTHGSIQDAVSGANQGDLIQVGSGTYDSVDINTEGLTLEGAGASATTIDAENSSSAVLIEADEVTVQGFHVEGFTELGIADTSDYMDNTVYIKDNEVTGPNSEDVGSATVQGIQISGGDGSEVINNTVEMIPEFDSGEWSSTGILPEGTDNAEIRGNTVDVSDSGIAISTYYDDATGNTIEGNDVTSDTGTGISVQTTSEANSASDTEIIDNTVDDSSTALSLGRYFDGDDISETDVSNNVFENNDVHVSDPDDFVDLNAILNDQANTFDPNGEVSENQIVPGEQKEPT